MKQLFFTWMLFTLTWVSCNKDNAEPDPFGKELLVASWKMTAQQVISGKDESVLESYEVEGCDALQEFIFNDDNTFTFTAYRKSKGECERRQDRDEVGTYRYDEETRKITFTYTDREYTDDFEILTLTSSEMRFLVYSGDYDKDGIDDSQVVVFNR